MTETTFVRPEFSFSGAIPPSKSLLIRQLLLALHLRAKLPRFSSRCDDVLAMHAACQAFAQGERHIDCGEAGLVFRLCVGYAACRGGDFVLTGSPRLLARPHAPLLSALQSLGVECLPCTDGPKPGLRVSGQTLQKPPGPISLVGSESSQFATSLLLNAWHLPFPLEIVCEKEPVSQGYLALSRELACRHGMQLDTQVDAQRMVLSVPARQTPRGPEQGVLFSEEADVSSAFAVAGLAAVGGRCHITNYPRHTLQPDHLFVDLLRQMGVPIQLGEDGLYVEQAAKLRPLHVCLAGAPDLTPVLAVLCSLADGETVLFGAPHLRGKESDRIATTCSLLQSLGRQCIGTPDGMRIYGKPLTVADREQPKHFDATGDHRLVMAAKVAEWAGFPLQISGLRAVRKSFPELLDIAALPTNVTV